MSKKVDNALDKLQAEFDEYRNYAEEQLDAAQEILDEAHVAVDGYIAKAKAIWKFQKKGLFIGFAIGFNICFFLVVLFGIG